eukprot:SAG11_NODE_9336_length_921_cov_1.121655_1_plen_126_part_10
MKSTKGGTWAQQTTTSPSSPSSRPHRPRVSGARPSCGYLRSCAACQTWVAAMWAWRCLLYCQSERNAPNDEACARAGGAAPSAVRVGGAGLSVGRAGRRADRDQRLEDVGAEGGAVGLGAGAEVAP